MLKNKTIYFQIFINMKNIIFDKLKNNYNK